MSFSWPMGWSIAAMAISALLLLTAGVRLTRVADELADRTGLGEALTGALMLGAVTSLSGLVTTTIGAASGDAGFAVSNAVGGIAAQTTFLALADLTYRRVNLEHAGASLPNLSQTMVLVSLLGIVLAASAGPDVSVLAIHPATVLLVGVYLFGLKVTREVQERPMWRPRRTADTVEDTDTTTPRRPLWRAWAEFAALGAVVAGTGWTVGAAGLSLAASTGMSGSLVGAVFTSVVTSLPELVTVLAAVRIGALTLAISNIIGGNSFDVLFVAVADVAFRSGSVFGAIDDGTVFLTAIAIVLTAILAAGMLGRERRHIGFEGVGILGFYALGIVGLVALA